MLGMPFEECLSCSLIIPNLHRLLGEGTQDTPGSLPGVETQSLLRVHSSPEHAIQSEFHEFHGFQRLFTSVVEKINQPKKIHFFHVLP